MWTPLQSREVFHLLFLRELCRKVDPRLFVVKGGVNLRFFFGSLRYSEDLDLDVKTIAAKTLQKNVMQLLGERSFRQVLKTVDIVDLVAQDAARSKQTETTQRFKLHLITAAGLDLSTKVEFSRREMGEGYCFDSVSPAILQAYRFPPIFVQHYTAQDAAVQKIRALAGRSVTQARDVFDLYLLLQALPNAEIACANHVSGAQAKEAALRLDHLSYAAYRDTVLAFLTPGDRRLYEKEEIWDRLCQTIKKLLESIYDRA